MADTKISDLTAASTLTGTEEIPLSDGTTTTKAATAQQIKDFVETAPTFAAGSTTAGSWPVFAHGTQKLTTPEHGAMEHTTFGLYFTPEPANRGIVVVKHLIYQNANYTLTNSTTEQKIFNQSTNGALNLAIGTYRFNCMLYITGMSTTTGNAAFDLDGAGTAVFGTTLYQAFGIDSNNPASTGNQGGSWSVTAQSGTPLVSGGTGTVMAATIHGVFEIATAGTIIPSITLTNAAAAVVNAGSFFECYSIGDTSVGFIGDWS